MLMENIEDGNNAIPSHPLAWLTSTHIAILTGFSLHTIRKRLCKWEASGLKVNKTKTGGKKILVKEWERFQEHMRKNEIKL